MQHKQKPSIAAVISALKNQTDKTQHLDWKEFEEHIKEVYQKLLNLKGDKVIVARDVVIIGQTGIEHQIDVYYEFELAGVRHQVAIECKSTKRALNKDSVMAFSAKVRDCPRIRGIIVAAHGYQSGAKKFAEDNGINALVLADLPSLGKLLGMRLEAAVIPTEQTVGQPFWTIFELSTGAPTGHQQDGTTYGLLFYSKKQAEEYFMANTYGLEWGVRGLSQENLRAYILTVDSMAGRYLLIQSVQNPDAKKKFLATEIERQALISEFYVGAGEITNEPMVLPSFSSH
jgi:hypothetical protein